MRADELDRVYREIRDAAGGPPEAYASVLERTLAACAVDPAAAEYLDVLDLHSELVGTHDRLGRGRGRAAARGRAGRTGLSARQTLAAVVSRS